nr:histidine phosphatase family protein [Synechococcus sp. CCY 9618]
MELWLIRHGATEWARAGRHTGRTDVPLLAEGETEARALAPALARQRFLAVLSSPLQRARRTCDLAGLGTRAERCDDLQEWNYGAYEGITTDEIRRTRPGWTVWEGGCPDGEDAADVQERCERVIQRCLTLAAAGDSDGDPPRIALFAHSHLLRALAGTWLGLGARAGALLVLGTGGLSVLGHERSTRTLLRWNVPVG